MDKQTITGNGGTSYTLDHAVANVNEIEVFVNNVRQEPSVAYTVAGTALTMTGNVASSDDFYVVFQGKALQTVVPPDGSVTSAKLDTNIAISGTLTTSGTLDVNSTLDVSSSNFKMTDLNSNAFYRTGTFTPEYSSTAATDPTAGILSGAYTTQIGRYIRIGDLVHIDVTLSTPSTITYTNGGATSQSVTIVGLPFTIKNLTNYNSAFSLGYFNGWNSWTSGYTPMGYGGYNTKTINLVYAHTNGVLSIGTSNIFGTTNIATIIFSMTYQTDEA